MAAAIAGTAINITGTGAVGKASTPSALIGFFCNSTTSGTLVLRDGGASGTQLSGTITPSAGTFYTFPASCPNGLHATIANTLDVTFFIQQGNS